MSIRVVYSAAMCAIADFLGQCPPKSLDSIDLGSQYDIIIALAKTMEHRFQLGNPPSQRDATIHCILAGFLPQTEEGCILWGDQMKKAVASSPGSVERNTTSTVDGICTGSILHKQMQEADEAHSIALKEIEQLEEAIIRTENAIASEQLFRDKCDEAAAVELKEASVEKAELDHQQLICVRNEEKIVVELKRMQTDEEQLTKQQKMV